MFKQTQRMTSASLIVALGLVCGFVPGATAQSGGPPKLSTNPGKHVIFPAKGQTPEQQEQDQLAAYTWATQQTGWDPYTSAEARDRADAEADKVSQSTRGNAVGGAARGALLGLAVGAIAGDAGEGAAIGAATGGLTTGMRGRQTRKQSGKGVEAGQEAYRQQFQIWDRNFVAAMEGKGYTVK